MATESIQLESQPALSILHGPSDTPLLDLTLAELLDFQCVRYGSRECLIIPWTGARWTYNDLRIRSLALAKALVARGIKHGDRVGIMAGNCEQYVAVFFACMRVGAILVILNNTYTASEAQYGLQFTQCKLLFTTPKIGLHDNGRLLALLRREPGELQDIVILRGESGPFTAYDQFVQQGSRLSAEAETSIGRNVRPYDVCNLQFTSGTTGHPKAAMLTHHNLVNNSRFIGDRMAFTQDDVLCCPPPLFHCFGLVLGLLAIVTHGGKVVYPTEVFDAGACLRAVSDERCTGLHGVPAMFDSIFSLPRPPNFDSSRLRTGIIAGAPVPRHLMELLFEDLGMTEFTSSYGLTEASPTCFNAYHDDPIHKKLTTVGTLMPHAHAKVVDRHGNTVPIGTKGELWIAGYQLHAGYWNNPEKTAEVMTRDEHGTLWLHTGDEVLFHPDGTCTITGRFKDIIIRGGENIYPLEIEERLIAHPSISRAIVVGLKHDRYGEVPAAFLLPQQQQQQGDTDSKDSPTRPTDDQVRTWTRETLGRHKAPVHIFWLGEDDVPATIPLTGSGKVKKFEMAKIGEELLQRRRTRTVGATSTSTMKAKL